LTESSHDPAFPPILWAPKTRRRRSLVRPPQGAAQRPPERRPARTPPSAFLFCSSLVKQPASGRPKPPQRCQRPGAKTPPRPKPNRWSYCPESANATPRNPPATSMDPI